MLKATIELRGNVLALTAGEEQPQRMDLDEALLVRLNDAAARYDKAVITRNWGSLPELGRDIAAMLNGDHAWLDRALKDSGTGDIVLEVLVPATPDERGRALLDVPWEILAPGGIYLAADPERLFRVQRRLGTPQAPPDPPNRDLMLMFMAADVEGQQVLEYEREESAILEATRWLDLALVVEESGCLEFLEPRLAQDRPEVLHLSCHGTIRDGQPVLMLETPEGREALTGTATLKDTLGGEEQMPGLVFVSACRTAEHGPAAASFAQGLVRAGLANVIGWDGSVYDSDAIRFAESFYRQLAEHRTVSHAVAHTRKELLRAHEADRFAGAHWHLARLYAGPAGAGALCAAKGKNRALRTAAGYKEFLDRANERVPVATAAEFVGRRRQAQRVLRAFREADGAGVLIHGMGQLGKSSLAARIVSRMPGHAPVVLFKHYDADAVFRALVAAVPVKLRPEFIDAYQDAVLKDDSVLGEVLEALLEGPFRCADTDTGARPILLIVDDLEQILADPAKGETATGVKPDYVTVLGAIIGAFDRVADGTDSRLLLTSRYTFALTDGRGRDLAARLVTVPLPPMDEVQREKQFRAAARTAGEADTEHDAEQAKTIADLVTRIKRASGGNPGLQTVLSRPLLSGEAEAAKAAVEAVEVFLSTGTLSAEAGDAGDFFRKISLQAYRDVLTAAETALLRAATLFDIPVPRAVLVAVGAAAHVEAAETALLRLEGLGLIDRYAANDDAEGDTAAVNPLARPLFAALDGLDGERLAVAAVPLLWRAWKDGDGDLPADWRGLEVARLALLCDAEPEILNAAAWSGGGFLFKAVHEPEMALDLITQAIDQLDRRGAKPGLPLLRLAAQCAERLGHGEDQDRFLDRGLAVEDGDDRTRAMLMAEHADRLKTKGELEAANQALTLAAKAFDRLGDERSRTITMGKIADILYARGNLDEALRIRQDEEIPVYERLGDVRERAVTMGKIADILQARGNLDEALRIRQEEQLPVYERLGDVRSRAFTMGYIADILQARGNLDEALRIRQEEQLPVYERLGDVRSRAFTMGYIADILQARGNLDEALRIRQDEQLPVYERLGDVRSRAFTMGKIADILYARGNLDEALRIRQDEQLPVYERLGDVRERAITMAKIADILQGRGNLDEALRIRQDEEIPVYERLGDVRSRAVTMGKIADNLYARGDLDEALRIRQDEEIPVYERLGDVRERAVTMGKIADILQARGNLDEALRLYLEENLPAAEAMGDEDGIAHVRFRCAQIRLARGGLEKGEAQEILEELAESFEIIQKIGHAVGVSQVGGLYGQLLALGGLTEEAIGVLDAAAAAYEMLGNADAVAHIRAWQERIRRDHDSPPGEAPPP